MKQIILIVAAIFMAVSAYAQFPNTSNKLRLGIQTTGDGLIYRHAGEPSWTPTGINNAWQSIDTLTGDLYAYRDGNWFLEIKGDLQQVYPLVINKTGSPILRGQVVSVDTSQIVQGDQIRIMPAIGDGGLSSELIMGVAANDIANDASGYVAWFGYVREVDQSDIAQTGITLNVGDILYLSATEPGRLTNVEPTPPALKTTIALVVRKPTANNMTLLVRPKLNEDLRDLNDVDLNGINNGQTIVWDSINTKWIAGDVGTTDVTSITAGVGLTGGTITSTGTIAADTAGVLVSKTFLTNQGYTTNTGTVTGTGANGRVSFWTGTNSQSGDDGLFWDNTNKRLGIGTTTPSDKLTIGNGNFRLIGVSGTGASIRTDVTTTNTNARNWSLGPSQFTFGDFAIKQSNSHNGNPLTDGAFRLYISRLGNLLINSTTDAGFMFDVNGTARFQGNTTITGTGFLNLPSGTTAQRPGTPLAGMMRNNTSNNNLDFYTGTAWENYLKSATATGLGTAGRVFFADANGRAAGDAGFFWDNTNKRLGIGTTTPASQLDITGTMTTRGGANVIYSSTPGEQDRRLVLNAINPNVSTIYNIDDGDGLYYPIHLGHTNTSIGLSINGINVGIGTLSPAARLDVTGTDAIRIPTGTTAQRPGTPLAGMMRNNTTNNNLDFYTGTAWENYLKSATATGLGTAGRVFYADANGRAAGALVGSGLTLSNDTLRVTASGTTNLTFSGASSPVTLNSDTGTDVTFTAGDGISFSQASNNLTMSKASPIYAVITVDSNRTSTFLAASVTPDTIDNPKLSQVGGVFSVVGNGIQYTSGTARTFLITANADFKFSEANNIVKFQGWRSNGGTVIDLGTFGTVESLLGNEIMHTSFSAITSLSNNDLLRFGFTPGAHTGDDDLVLTNLSITITQL